MQLIKKLFGRPSGAPSGPESAQFHESETSTEIGSRNAPRRELVQVVLRDSMRRHGIPSAWIDCRILSVLSRNLKTGMHVQLIVRDGADRLLTYVPAFQGSFMQEISRFDPRVDEWLFSLSWQFHPLPSTGGTAMPDPGIWAEPAAPVPLPQAPVPPVAAPGLVASPEVAAAPRATPAPLPTPAGVVTVAPRAPVVDRVGDQEVLEDLQALYAIRDEALRHGRPGRAGPAGEQDFEATRPGTDADFSAPAPRSPR